MFVQAFALMQPECFYFILFFIRALKIVQDLDHPVFQKSQIHMSTVGSGFS